MPGGRVYSTGGVVWGPLKPAAYALGRMRRIFHDPARSPNGRRVAPEPLDRETIRVLRDKIYHALNRYRAAQKDDATQSDWRGAEDRLRRVASTILNKGPSRKRFDRLATHLGALSGTQRQSLYANFNRQEIRYLNRARHEELCDIPRDILVRVAAIELGRRQARSSNPSQSMLIQECMGAWEQITGASAGGRTDFSGVMRDPDRSYSAMQAWLEDSRKYIGGAPFTIDRVRDVVAAAKKIQNRPPEGAKDI